MLLKTKKSAATGTTFIVKYVRFFSKPSPDFIRNQNSLPILIMPLVTKKSNLNYDTSLSSKIITCYLLIRGYNS